MCSHRRRTQTGRSLLPLPAVTQRPLQPLVLNLQGSKLSGAIPVHNDQSGNVLVGVSQIPACRLQLSTQQFTLVFQHLFMGARMRSLSHACASLNVDDEVLQVEYQFLLQTVGKGLLTSLRFRYLIP